MSEDKKMQMSKELHVKSAKLNAALIEDEALRKKFKADPKMILKEFGLDVSEGVEIVVHENTEKQFHWVLSSISSNSNLEKLQKIAGGGEFSPCPSRSPFGF